MVFWRQPWNNPVALVLNHHYHLSSSRTPGESLELPNVLCVISETLVSWDPLGGNRQICIQSIPRLGEFRHQDPTIVLHGQVPQHSPVFFSKPQQCSAPHLRTCYFIRYSPPWPPGASHGIMACCTSSASPSSNGTLPENQLNCGIFKHQPATTMNPARVLEWDLIWIYCGYLLIILYIKIAANDLPSNRHEFGGVKWTPDSILSTSSLWQYPPLRRPSLVINMNTLRRAQRALPRLHICQG